MRLWLAILVFVVPSVGLAQTIELSTSTGGASLNIGAGDCAKTYGGTWNWPTGGVVCAPLLIWATEGTSCADTKKDGDVLLDETPISELRVAATGTFPMKVADLPAFKNAGTDGGVSCGAQGIEKEHTICASTRFATSSLDTTCSTTGQYFKATTPISVNYDTKPPDAPVIQGVASFDGALNISFSAAEDVSQVHIELRGPNDADFSRRASVGRTASPTKVKDLANNETYTIRLFAQDAAGNVSDASAEATGTPVKTDGFWDIYRRNGGDEPGGCTMAPASLSIFAAAGLLVMGLLRRRRVR